MKPPEFDTSIWERNLTRKAEEREKLRQAVLFRLGKALNALSEKYSWEEIFIFGSITRKSEFHDGSEFDIGIESLKTGNRTLLRSSGI
jgi:predicted nucleotidyltransferase